MTKDEIITEGQALGYAGKWPDGELRYLHLTGCPQCFDNAMSCRCGLWSWATKYESACAEEAKAKEVT